MRRVLVLIILFWVVSASLASLPQIKSYERQKDLISGVAKGVSIGWDGELWLAPVTKQIFSSERPFAWDFVADSRGNIFVATGDGAKIYHVSPDGNAKIISQWDTCEIYAMAVDNKGNVYAGTSPDGKIYRIHQHKEAELFVDLKVKYVWDMLFDKQNNCYVATGDSGAIYVIDARGKVSIFYKSNETHIRCLAWDNNNQLLAGSYQNGYLYRIDSSGEGFVVYDSEYQEIHKICCGRDGTIYIAGLGAEASKATASKEPGKDIHIDAMIDDADVVTISPKPVIIPSISKGGVIKIQPNGMIKNIWQQPTDQVQSIALLEDQTLLAGAGDKGRLYRIDSQDESSYLLNFEASQIIAMKPGIAGKVWIATSNLAKIFQLEPEFEKKGSYESEVFDAQTLTQWGSIQWEEQLPPGCSIKLATRSGNTEKQNSTWSRWSELNKGEVIKSPVARFLQWKMELSSNRGTDSPKVNNIKVSYLQQNLPPEILAITIHAIEKQKEFQPIPTAEPSALQISIVEEEDDETGSQKQAPPPGIKRQLPDGYRRVSWKVRDQNNDQLSYRLYFQQKNDQNWWLLKDDLTRTSHTWDSRMMPDGHYRIKILADDKKSNPINTAKLAEKISDWFVIDNTGATIEKIVAKKIANDSLQISFQVMDELSSIQQVQISYDLQKWLWVYPEDLVCDSKQESFQFNIGWKQGQFQSIIVKAQDNAGNINYSRISLKE